MSLSAINETNYTPKEISDEILAKTVVFCKETGYRQNAVMITFFWSAFLYCAKDYLDDELTEKVMCSFPASLGKIFPDVAKDSSLAQSASDMSHHYYNNFQNDFDNLRKQEERQKLLSIANKINSNNNPYASCFVKPGTDSKFFDVSININTSIYKIIHKPTDIADKYQSYSTPLNTLAYQDSQDSAPTYIPTYTPTYSPAYKTIPKKKFKKTFYITLLVFGLLLVAFLINYANADNDLIPVDEPRSGTILEGFTFNSESTITVTASKIESCVVKLKSESGYTVLCFYVRAGEKATVKVPESELYVYFASGDTWYGYEHLFGSHTDYQKDKDTVVFSKGKSWSYILEKTSNGNISLETVRKKDF